MKPLVSLVFLAMLPVAGCWAFQTRGPIPARGSETVRPAEQPREMEEETAPLPPGSYFYARLGWHTRTDSFYYYEVTPEGYLRKDPVWNSPVCAIGVKRILPDSEYTYEIEMDFLIDAFFLCLTGGVCMGSETGQYLSFKLGPTIAVVDPGGPVPGGREFGMGAHAAVEFTSAISGLDPADAQFLFELGYRHLSVPYRVPEGEYVYSSDIIDFSGVFISMGIRF